MAIALILPVLAAASVIRGPGLIAAWSDDEAGIESMLDGPAVGWAERSRPWLTEMAAATGDRQRESLSELGEHLASDTPERSSRAGILIGVLLADQRIESPTRILAQDLLLGQLERRVDTGARWSVGADIVCARALDASSVPDGLSDGGPTIRERLSAVAAGEFSHPNLATRVECAATALALAKDTERGDPLSKSLTHFLLAVLRAETPDQAKSPRTWPRITTLAWVKTRSAETLARWTGTKNLFRPDGPWAHQMEEADRFEALLD
ncbi:hypothetical protein Poly30_31480 [Planctomycetes bacterium Poly30]|uniref:Uncharacterized protein n=1 Tax=Saltatorellus ferox TaxID=2528018 RepID=A0A518EU46_9BACT|nr:hypothetical protein Poly30_31480 [Planctomycetes bacterium Poly30]